MSGKLSTSMIIHIFFLLFAGWMYQSLYTKLMRDLEARRKACINVLARGSLRDNLNPIIIGAKFRAWEEIYDRCEYRRICMYLVLAFIVAVFKYAFTHPV